MIARPLRAVAALAVLAATAALAGCSNPFLPAQAPAPGAGGNSAFTPDYLSSEGVLTTIASAINARGAGIGETAYLAAFADSATQGLGCTFTLDDSVVAERLRASIVVPTWRRELEPGFYRYLCTVDPTGDYDVTFLPTPGKTDEGNDAIDDRVVRYRDYLVTGASTQVATGSADIEMRLITSPTRRWVITAWSDHVRAGLSADTTDPGDFCFSRLRIDSYNH